MGLYLVALGMSIGGWDSGISVEEANLHLKRELGYIFLGVLLLIATTFSGWYLQRKDVSD